MALNNLNWSVEYYEENIEECNAILNSLDNYEDVPLVNSVSVQTFPDGTLVRYRGMVQDMLNPEYYSTSFTVVNKDNNETYIRSGKFRDVASCKANEELNWKEDEFVPSERLVYFCSPIPGTNDWVYDLQKPQILCEQGKEHSPGLKRPASDDDDTEMDTDKTESSSSPSTKRNKPSSPRSDTNPANNTYDTNKYFPIPDKNGLPCIVKVYEEEEKCGFVLNDVIEVIGFLSLNPTLEANWEDPDVEDKAHHPPPSLVPRIHAVQIKKLKHWNPLLKQIISYGDMEQLAETARSDLHLILTQLLFEDTLAAEYVICNLISRIYIRNESSTIGKFSLNLYNIQNQNFGSGFYNVLKTLVTNSHYVPLSTSLLNETSFIPRKDYESNRLWSGMLQLCDDVHLMLDETGMNEGQLNNTGCLNVSALQRLFRDQEVQYDFGYYPVKYNTNIPLLVVSEGKSMFEADVRLKVKSEGFTETYLNESLQAVKLYLNSDVLRKLRIYLTSVRLRDFELGDEMMRKIGEDYVTLRQQDRHVSSSDLHFLLILSRLIALSRGRNALRPEDWAQALEMETERKSRFRNWLLPSQNKSLRRRPVSGAVFTVSSCPRAVLRRSCSRNKVNLEKPYQSGGAPLLIPGIHFFFSPATCYNNEGSGQSQNNRFNNQLMDAREAAEG